MLEETEREESLLLLRDVHVRYCYSGLGELPSSFAMLDASKPWICFWILHSLALLDAPEPTEPSYDNVVEFLISCQNETGGFGGGVMQIAHLAPTYASVAALVTIGGQRALAAVNRASMFSFLNRMCLPPERGGGFSITDDGESDLRSCYCALAVAHMLNLDVQTLVQKSGVVDYIQRCQTYEGGLGGEPGNEAHGGYTFCGLAALLIAGQAGVLDLPRLLRWAVYRQGWVEGGFNGRTNKLVDGCYSLWQGGIFPLFQQLGPEYLQQIGVPRSIPDPMAVDDHSDQELIVPPLPDIDVKSIIQMAEDELQQRDEEQQSAFGRAMEAEAEVEATMSDYSIRSTETSGIADQARHLLDSADEAHAAFELAEHNFNVAHCCAELLAPAPNPVATLMVGGDDPGGGAALSLLQPLYNAKALQFYILKACQVSKGGLRDKPGKHVDFYHTCYCLSGLSTAQHYGGVVLGPSSNLLRKTDALCNVLDTKLQEARDYLASQPY